MDCAVQLFARCVELDPDYAPAYAGLADCWSYIYIYSDRSEVVREQAHWASTKAVEMDPLSPEAQASHGFSLSIAGRDLEAEQAFETAIQLDPELFEARYFFARHWFIHGQSEKAIEQYDAAMRARPEDFQAPLLAAQSYDDVGRLAEAAEIRKRGVENAIRHLSMNPDDTRAMYMAANGMVALGDCEQGREYAQRALAMHPDDGMLLYNVGCIYSMLGNVEEAVDCVVQAAQKGLTQKAWYEHDNNLDNIRSHPRFRQLLDELA
jgi:adenylate cyclase